jgi:predicted regulator of Ras-like GTPase activity (Roadblock/LC7/MglB family)
MTAVSRQVLDLDFRSDMVIGRLTMIRQAIISGATACCRRFLAALHESRRKQSVIERARHRHLIYDADTGIHFVVRRQADQPLRL